MAETKKSKKLSKDFDEENAKVLAELLVDPATPQAVQLHIINELNDASKNETFFETMFNEMLSRGKCLFCDHENHWLIPEDNLNEMGWVSSEEDKRVLKHTDAETCPELEESCSKKKTSA